jgi:hypothetical protein
MTNITRLTQFYRYMHDRYGRNGILGYNFSLDEIATATHKAFTIEPKAPFKGDKHDGDLVGQLLLIKRHNARTNRSSIK